ncbi:MULTISPECIES: ABC transporter ATP-binding protein [Paraburkholderia]|uniref:Spermidine/putrescine import ATP-binding protein PotA n=2 Tax=Paraburkholderia TaxID=1822464 RepID=A0A6J5FKU6_9BURK|nr:MULTISPECIES: ABC transporter ATP-binding protein [Paraburkholderia]GGC64816.1 polyamine-transporting ATPase [Paraburkholderia caffeinilytica]CAB3782038.1 Spermidine/putrescine import ATP-binding protein PotA [Paraburkholderia caffeinitolerans]CAB3802600.1 Spermidine/putrescine import ATP-binding protein PotA [Paraburkholderia caffeinilytica]
MSAFISFDAVSKSYGDVKVIDGLNLDINRGEFVSLLGPSGSGKTTMLMMLAGFESPTRGKILVDGKRVDHLPPHARNMGVVFQSYALFPHMSIADNIAFPLKMRGLAKSELKAKVARALDMVQLSSAAGRKPAQLSGGQQQRIALARALVFEPEVVLMDEPLGALDKQLREHMQLELRSLHKSLGLTVVFVTHDQNEAITMSDRIAVFNAGKIEQIDDPKTIYSKPSTRFVAQFIGETNLMSGSISQLNSDGSLIELTDGTTVLGRGDAKFRQGADIMLSVRPEALSFSQVAPGANALSVTIEDLVFQGDHTRVHLKSGDTTLAARVPGAIHTFEVGQATKVYFAPEACAVVAP